MQNAQWPKRNGRGRAAQAHPKCKAGALFFYGVWKQGANMSARREEKTRRAQTAASDATFNGNKMKGVVREPPRTVARARLGEGRDGNPPQGGGASAQRERERSSRTHAHSRTRRHSYDDACRSLRECRPILRALWEAADGVPLALGQRGQRCNVGRYFFMFAFFVFQEK